jgi:Oligosaccharyl transferase STT3 subunit
MLSADSPVNKWKPAIRITILLLICSVAIIHEFDPWFNFRATKFLVNNNFKEFWNFFDSESWYPLGRNVGATVYPGLMVRDLLCSLQVGCSTSSFISWPFP